MDNCFGAPAALFCYIDRDKASYTRTGRAPLDETVTFVDG
jgi:hypothetical protein